MKKRVWIYIFAIVLIGSGDACAQNLANQNFNKKDEAAPAANDKAAVEDAVPADPDSLGYNDLVAMGEDQVAGTAGDESSHYTLGNTDVIDIKVLRHPEVSGQYIINNEGKIQYEFVGDIKLAGLTKEEATKALVKRLSEYIVNPDVTVTITGYNSKIVYIVGEVGHPGKVYMRGDTITVREALVQAGLPLLTGVTKRSRLITPSKNAKTRESQDVNVYALIFQGDLSQNKIMKPGDVLFVPPTFLTKTIRTLRPVAAPIGTATGAARDVAHPGL